jgi:UDP-N-acetylglucosamine 4,6-dehydratase
MTRFWITLDQGVKFVCQCLESMAGGEIFVPKLPSMNIMDLAGAVAPDSKVDITGVRPGEKLHEVLLSQEESSHAEEFDDMYVINPVHPWWTSNGALHGKPITGDFAYASDTNTRWLTRDEILGLI